MVAADTQSAAWSAVETTVTHLFEEHVVRQPQSEALVAGAVRHTYASLDAEVLACRDALAAAGAGRGTRVAVVLPRGDALVVTVLAVLRLGAVYVPGGAPRGVAFRAAPPRGAFCARAPRGPPRPGMM